jgi:hypothetical protein
VAADGILQWSRLPVLRAMAPMALRAGVDAQDITAQDITAQDATVVKVATGAQKADEPDRT